MGVVMSRGDYESRQKVEKKENERKKNILILIHQHLLNIGYSNTALKLEEESNLELDTYAVADNMDLYVILREFEEYYEYKFSKPPKFSIKISEGKMAGLPKIQNQRNSKSKNNFNINNNVNASNRNKKTPNNNNNTNKHIDVSNLNNNHNNNNNNNNQSTSTTATNSNDIKLELNINPFNPQMQINNPNLMRGGKPKNKNEPEDKYSFNDHKESILLKPIPSDMPDDLRELALLVKREIILENPNVLFKDIVGLDTPKQIIQEAFLWPVRYPIFFTDKLSEPWKGILLFGPPGTGKTLLAKGVATEMRTTFFNISAATVVSKWRGDSEKIIKVLFDLARHYQPSTIFLDEIDSIMSSRGSSQDEHEGSRRMKTELLIQLDGLQKNEGVFLLAASNTPWDLDPALLRRLEKRVMVNLPTKEGREYMIRNFIPEMNQKGINYMKYAEALEGYSGSDIKLLCKEALMTRTRKAINVIEKDTKGKMYGIKDFPVTKEDFEEAMSKVKPAYTYKTELYIKWEKEYGST